MDAQCGIRKLIGNIEKVHDVHDSEGKIAPPSLDLSCLTPAFEPAGHVYDGLIVLPHIYNLHSSISTIVLWYYVLVLVVVFIFLFHGFHSKAFETPNLWNIDIVGSFA